ncbi:hypothetical protein CMT44_04250 [Elizabethkingia anophelis]|nr:hypothetical protein [Elizabethkingia anophelis]
MSTIDLTKLSPEDRQKLIDEALEINKKEKVEKADNRKTFKKLSEEYVKRNIPGLIKHHNKTASVISNLFADFKALKEMKAEVYGTRINEQDSHTSTTEDGKASITIGYNVTIGFDGTESEGVRMIKEFINSLSSDEENVQKLSAAVNTFLKPNAKTGMLNPSKIIELSKLRDQYNDERFNQGLDIIFDAQQKRQNSMYVSGWQIIEDEEGKPVKVEFRFTV